jgi:putative sterol carrier protein
MAQFPSEEWVIAAKAKLNDDARYAQIAKAWEGDIRFVIEPGGPLAEPCWIYLDLWHGTCRDAYLETPNSAGKKTAFTLKAPYENFAKILQGELDPMQAMLTRKLVVQGNMAVMMRSVPTVLDFVRCCRAVTDKLD